MKKENMGVNTMTVQDKKREIQKLLAAFGIKIKQDDIKGWGLSEIQNQQHILDICLKNSRLVYTFIKRPIGNLDVKSFFAANYSLIERVEITRL